MNISAITAMRQSVFTRESRLTSAASYNNAALQINNRLNSQVAGLDSSVKNAQDAISAAQTAGGALTETNNILQRMSELAKYRQEVTITADDRKNLATEYNALVGEVDRIAKTTTFGGQKLLDGSSSITVSLAGSQDTTKINIGNMTAAGLGVSKIAEDGSDFSTAQTQLFSAITKVEAQRSVLGVTQSRIENNIDGVTSTTNVEAARGRIQDMDYAAEATELTKQQILQQADTAILGQENQIPQNILNLLK